MARIAGVNLEDKNRVDYSLTRIKGIGWTLSRNILKKAKIDPAKRLSQVTGEELSRIAGEVEKYPIEGELLRIIRSNVSRLRQIGSYRGIRHTRNLPARGQRTKTNARTKRGKRKTVGAFKKETLSKTQKPESGGE